MAFKYRNINFTPYVSMQLKQVSDLFLAAYADRKV
jgi:hypothetical protein